MATTNRSSRGTSIRRGGLLAVTLIIAAIAVIACGGSDTPAQRSADQPSSTPAVSHNATGPPPTSTTRTIIDATGTEVVVPANPQRVLALSEPDLDAALALEVTPVGTLSGRGQPSVPRYLAGRSTEVTIIGPFVQPDIEKAIQLKPDLILAGGFPDDKAVSLLRQVAPTVVTFSLGEDWKTQFQRVATALNREDAANAFLARYDQRIQEVRAALGPNANATVSIVRWNPQGPAYMLNDSFSSTVLRDLGLNRPAAQQQPGQGHSSPLSLEALNQVDADWIFFGTLSAEGDAVKAMESATNGPTFQQLQAVKNNHVVPIDGSLWTSIAGPLGAMAILDDVQKAMAAR